MNKNLKRITLLLTTLISLSGCKGAKVTLEEAKELVDGISIASINEYKNDKLSFTYEYISSYGDDEDEVVFEEYIKYDGIKDNMYVKGENENGKYEFYCGFIDGNYYYFDVINKKYDRIDGEVGIATYYVNHSNQIMKPALMCADVLDKLNNFIAIGDLNCTFYSSGKGNIYLEYDNSYLDSEYECQIEDNLLIYEEYDGEDKEGNDIHSEAKIKYRANVKLPSLDKYSKNIK